MPNWNQLLDELKRWPNAQDVLRRRHLEEVHQITGRNVIAYYSGWLQNGVVPGVEINDDDKNGFMSVIHEMDRKVGLDLLLHTPGGETAATESLVDYLRAMFDDNIRSIVPQLAMSGGTMIACAAKAILMGKHSSLGPIDPQFRGIPAHGLVEEFQRAVKEVREDNAAIAIWQPILAKYNPTWIGECEKAMEWSKEMTTEWLRSGMFRDDADADERIQKIIKELTDHALTKSHARHLSAGRCRKIGLKVEDIEADSRLQEAALSFHHSCMLTFSTTGALKIIENHKGVAFVRAMTPSPAVVPTLSTGPEGRDSTPTT